MLDPLSFAQLHLDNEFYDSALLISQNLPIQNPQNAFIIIKSLYHTKNYNRIKSLIQANPMLLKYREILFYYIKSGNFYESYSSFSIKECISTDLSDFSFDMKSLVLFYNSFNKKDKIKKKYLINSFKADSRNIEPLCALIRESLAEMDEILFLVKDTEYHAFIKTLFQFKYGEKYCSPIFTHLISKYLYKNNLLDELFRFSIMSIKDYPNSEFSHESLGLFYLATKQYTQSRGCYLKAIEINKKYGFGYLGIGISDCCLSETEKGINYMWKAHDIMDGSYLPSYFLAYEYHQMNNYRKAKYFYTVCLNKIIENENRKRELHGEERRYLSESDCNVINSAVYCLIYNEDYKEAMEYLRKFEICNLLNSFCYLFLGELEEARKVLDECDGHKFVHSVKGFLLHLVDDFKGAISEYEQCISIERTQVVESLLVMALKNQSGLENNNAFDYSNCLFNGLEYKQRYLPYSN